ncbi:TPA: TIGR03759 family integrating conjugative element protein [Pseudomonas aeruginosa]|uniref:TIGR03759 family integrating conjugative element protein n=1 Tax=Pseudomonas aeruginosa TaxID=287 RepID=UPI0003B95DF5|nr:TIGR03759 family integrating conjugative element protein [Pseudomonas aeruginosa]EKT9493092.1 TIGR03759 family integrating conjugative element protein [Pseudomonas aeruginosa]ERY35608.1 integrating conjugative element protein [Pseudomonas aeruginosa BL13]MBH4028459.1 TIGR03759 family integrating conjugative element protein [Pseudomonas aeruginosa]MBV5530571.1 TIGR03759 family integrating conjugative element protein [Pseudomonas aeruginosa]RTS98480.1 TIGR03759 family integrating conjugative 
MSRSITSLTLSVGLMVSSIAVVQAQNTHVAESPIASSLEQAASIVGSDERKARDWGLRPEEWSRYKDVMQGPLGIFSPNLDPLTALGIEARSEEERRRYAELQVQVEARRVEKTLAYQRAYDAAWQRLHPDMLRVNLPGANAAFGTGDMQGDAGRVAVFVKERCTSCNQIVQQLQNAVTEFDLYMVGSRQDDGRIREWAKRALVDPSRVRSGSITLNHDAGRWVSLGLQGELPAVVRQVNGQWQRQ